VISHKLFPKRIGLPLLVTVLLLALLLAVTLLLQPVSAQQTVDPESGITLDEVNEVARELWCPLCSGVRLDACELKACVQMKEMIAIKLSEGEDVDAIKDYFVDQYGPQVLGEPPRQGFNWLAWILPVIALALGGVFLWRQMQRMMKPATESGADASNITDATSSEVAEKQPSADEYEQLLEEELSRYD